MACGRVGEDVELGAAAAWQQRHRRTTRQPAAVVLCETISLDVADEYPDG